MKFVHGLSLAYVDTGLHSATSRTTLRVNLSRGFFARTPLINVAGAGEVSAKGVGSGSIKSDLKFSPKASSVDASVVSGGSSGSFGSSDSLPGESAQAKRLKKRLKAAYGLDSHDLLPGSAERVLPPALMKAALSAGVHWGRAAGQVHCDMRPYLLGRREGASIFDLRWTFRLLGRALSFLREAVSTKQGANSSGVSRPKGRVLFIGAEGLDADNPHCLPSKLLRAAAKRCGESAMGVREANLFLLQEVGSLHSGRRSSVNPRSSLANASNSYKSSKFRQKQSTGGQFLPRQGQPSQGGILQEKKLPVVAIVLIGGHLEGFGDLLRAAKARACPVVSIVDSASSLKDISYPIPGNTRSVHSLYLCLDLISYALQKKVIS